MDPLAIRLFTGLIPVLEKSPPERAKGERWLMAELLLTALHDSKLPPVSYRSEARIRDNAREWIRRGNVGVVSFNDACAYLRRGRGEDSGEGETMIGSYGSIYNLGHRALGELFDGPVVIEEKVDGSQFSFARINGEFLCRSKGQDMHPDAPEKMFARGIEVARALTLPDGLIFRSEYLQKPKHNALAYDRVPTNHLAVFDVHRGDGEILQPAAKRALVESLGLECVPLIHEGPFDYDFEKIKALLDRESFLGGKKIEGVVIKNYAKFGPDKKTLMGKYVSEAFKETNKLNWKITNPSSGDVLLSLTERYRTENRWLKAVQHLREMGVLEETPRDIPKVLLEVQADIEKECAEEIRQLLWEHFWPKLRRSAISGLPEFYKEYLAKAQPSSPPAE